MKIHKMNQAVVTAAFTFLLLFSTTLMAELKVESDKDNVVSSRLEGRWQANKAISNRLADHDWGKTMGFHADDKVVTKIPEKYEKFLADKTIYMAGIMKSGKMSTHSFSSNTKAIRTSSIFVNGMAIHWVTPNPLT